LYLLNIHDIKEGQEGVWQAYLTD